MFVLGPHLLLLEHVVVEVLLQLLIGQIDAELQEQADKQQQRSTALVMHHRST
jgi:hypothetical protein